MNILVKGLLLVSGVAAAATLAIIAYQTAEQKNAAKLTHARTPPS